MTTHALSKRRSPPNRVDSDPWVSDSRFRDSSASWSSIADISEKKIGLKSACIVNRRRSPSFCDAADSNSDSNALPVMMSNRLNNSPLTELRHSLSRKEWSCLRALSSWVSRRIISHVMRLTTLWNVWHTLTLCLCSAPASL